MRVTHHVDDGAPVGETHSGENIIIVLATPVVVKRIRKVWICSDDEGVLVASGIVNRAHGEHVVVRSLLRVDVVALVVGIVPRRSYSELACDVSELVKSTYEEVLVITVGVRVDSAANIHIPGILIYSYRVRNGVFI